MLKYEIPAIRNSDLLTGNHTCILKYLLSEFKSHINLSPNDNFSKLEWLMLFLIVSRSLRLESKTNYFSPSNDIVLVWFFLSLLLLLLSEACPDHNLCWGSELITGRCRLRNTTGISTWTIPLHLLHQWPPRPATIHCSTICRRHYRLPHYNIWGWCRTPPGRPRQTRTMGRRLVHAVPSSKMYSPHRHQQAEPQWQSIPFEDNYLQQLHQPGTWGLPSLTKWTGANTSIPSQTRRIEL